MSSLPGFSAKFGRHSGKLSRSVFSGPIATILRERILEGELPPGTKLSEARLAAEFATSRGPVRSAFHALENEGLVETQPNGRMRVVGFSDDDVADLVHTRFVLERAAAERAIERHADLAPLEDALAVMAAEGGSTDDLIDLDIAFHLALLDASGSRFLSHAWLANASVIRASIAITTRRLTESRPSAGFEQAIGAHRLILEGMVAADLDRVSTALDDHFGLTESYFPPRDQTPPH